MRAAAITAMSAALECFFLQWPAQASQKISECVRVCTGAHNHGSGAGGTARSNSMCRNPLLTWERRKPFRDNTLSSSSLFRQTSLTISALAHLVIWEARQCGNAWRRKIMLCRRKELHGGTPVANFLAAALVFRRHS